MAAPAVPGVAPLPGAGDEAAAVRTLLPGSRLFGTPTRTEILRVLPESAVAHFACHAFTDWDEPGASHLVLPDHDAEPLSVTDISSLKMDGGLAYLSACSTMVGVPELADEAVHITGAFHLAGYHRVIGTLWPVNDLIAAMLARNFYARLTNGGRAAPLIPEAARMLHESVRDLRTRMPGAPEIWAAYVHVGI